MPPDRARLSMRASSVLIAAASILGGLLLVAPAASAAIKVAWSSSGNLSRLHDELESLACPSDQLCMGVTANGRLALSRQPSSGTSWHLSGKRRVNSLSCPSQVCLAGLGRGNSFAFDLYASRHPEQGIRSFVRVAASGDFERADAITCPTSAFCAGLDALQNAWFSRSPSQPGSWHRRPGPRNRLSIEYRRVVCPSSSVCLAYATSAFTERVAVIREPANPRSRWTFTNADPATAVTNKYCFQRGCFGEQVTGGTCVAPAACLLTTGYGAIVTSLNIEADPSSWTRTVIYGSGIHRPGYYGLSDPACFSGSLCYVLGTRGDLLVSTAPFSANPGAWQDFPFGQGRVPTHRGRQTLSCPSVQTCFVLVNAGHGRQEVLRGQVAVAS
jgi:hypothetical protein